MNILDFFSSESGLGSRHKGLSMGWIAGILGGTAAIVGTADATHACCSTVKCANGLWNTVWCVSGEPISQCDCP